MQLNLQAITTANAQIGVFMELKKDKGSTSR